LQISWSSNQRTNRRCPAPRFGYPLDVNFRLGWMGFRRLTRIRLVGELVGGIHSKVLHKLTATWSLGQQRANFFSTSSALALPKSGHRNYGHRPLNSQRNREQVDR
jgi:hypothetical protein